MEENKEEKIHRKRRAEQGSLYRVKDEDMEKRYAVIWGERWREGRPEEKLLGRAKA